MLLQLHAGQHVPAWLLESTMPSSASGSFAGPQEPRCTWPFGDTAPEAHLDRCGVSRHNVCTSRRGAGALSPTCPSRQGGLPDNGDVAEILGKDSERQPFTWRAFS